MKFLTSFFDRFALKEVLSCGTNRFSENHVELNSYKACRECEKQSLSTEKK